MSGLHDAPERSKVERFALLLGTCQRRVFLYALSLLHHAADAEEVLQETNLVLWRKFDEYRPDTDFSAWACRIAHYEVLKLRQRQGREHLLSSEFIEALAAEANAAVDRSEERREALRQCLGKLSEKDRHLVAERYRPGATTRGVAEALGRSFQGTRKSLHRIRLALMECIQRSMVREGRA